MNKNTLRFLGTVIFAIGAVDAINIVNFIPMNYISWALAIIGIVILIASNFIPKQKTDQ
ncbi:hypothetical protein QGM71_19925 [Virgibacillus sp. C22-A2]|uniref:DUF5668 domain-containing protein n=1 Tax=Virgibacillus tibetensis TaxID=3042313 RepID=A0ABU6KKB4_9BACI|nr:hypothetical protein [Virgibacillus sp. C22-A2]